MNTLGKLFMHTCTTSVLASTIVLVRARLCLEKLTVTGVKCIQDLLWHINDALVHSMHAGHKPALSNSVAPLAAFTEHSVHVLRERYQCVHIGRPVTDYDNCRTFRLKWRLLPAPHTQDTL